MEDPEEERGVEEYYPCSSGEEDECNSSKLSWIWNSGLKLGKTVVLTGVVISSAPVVLPPLVFASALGFAVSVPFGVVLASYACTEKVMSKLLPMPAPSPFWEHKTMLTDETDGGEPEFGEEIVMQKRKREQMEEMENEMSIEFVEDEKREEQQEEKLYKDETFKAEGYEEVQTEALIEESKNEKPSPEVKRVIVVVGEEKENETDGTKPTELVVVSKVVKNEEQGSTVLVENVKDEGDAAGESATKNKKKNKHHSKKSHGTLASKKEDKHSSHSHKVGEKTNEAVPDAKNTSTKEADKDAARKTVVPNDRSSVAAVSSKPAAGNQGRASNGKHAPANSKTTGAELKCGEGRKTDEPNISTGNVDSSEKSAQQGVPVPEPKQDAPSNKIPLSEEKIWDQINALRVIVGYEAARHKSCVEELKALYIFTGVEPPSSFNKATDLGDAADKLQFLMSIVGVK